MRKHPPIRQSRRNPTSNVGPFTFWHNYEPLPFNPEYNPQATKWRSDVTHSMEADGYYEKHTREECARGWRRRYDVLVLSI